MRFRLFSIATVLILALGWTSGWTDEPAKKMTDAEMTTLIVGKWYDERYENGAAWWQTDTFQKDGTFSSDRYVKRKGVTGQMSVTGTWRVIDGVLIETIETCDPHKNGDVSKDQVLSINEKEFRIKPATGKAIVKTRLAE